MKRFWRLFLLAALVLYVSFATNSPSVSGQSSGSQTPTQPIPDWQTKAGGTAKFDVASVRLNLVPPTDQNPHSNVPLGPFDAFNPTGGLFSATNYGLQQYMLFAYKLTPYQVHSIFSHMPKWVNTNRYEIQARASGNPTKDQFRLMMQTLLAERFKLAVHHEIEQLPVMALVLDKPGKLGAHLQQHPEDAFCSTSIPPPSAGPAFPPTVAGGFPALCNAETTWTDSGRYHAGGRNMSLQSLADSMTGFANNIDRPVLDRTGLTGKFDFVFEFSPQRDFPTPPGATFQPDSTGPTFQEALKDQLGLKLESQTGPVDVLVVDHIEEPSPN